MKNNKIIKIILLFLIIIVVTGCNSNGNKTNTDEIIYITLKINMPLSFDDLDNYFELSLKDELEKNEVGKVIGDGSPVDENGPYATDIEIDVEEGKLNQLESIISKYRYPKGSYLEVEGEKVKEFGDLLGVRLSYKNMSEKEIKENYNSMKNILNGKYVYSSLFNVNQKYTSYFYGESIDILKDEIMKQIYSKKLNDKITVTEMLDYIKDK